MGELQWYPLRTDWLQNLGLNAKASRCKGVVILFHLSIMISCSSLKNFSLGSCSFSFMIFLMSSIMESMPSYTSPKQGLSMSVYRIMLNIGLVIFIRYSKRSHQDSFSINPLMAVALSLLDCLHTLQLALVNILVSVSLTLIRCLKTMVLEAKRVSTTYFKIKTVID